MEEWGFGRWLGAVVASLVMLFGFIFVVHGIAYGEWQLNWWYQVQNNNRQAKMIQDGFNFQTALGQRITVGIANVSQETTNIVTAQQNGDTAYANALKAQRENDANTVCYQATQINGAIPQGAPQGNWIKANCLNGSVSPSSVYYYNGG